MRYTVKVNNLKLGGDNPLFLIAGPCVIEDDKHTFAIAKKLKEITAKFKVPFIFKTSYDKANRTSAYSFRGPGLERGLDVLANIKKELGLAVLSDVHSVEEVEKSAQVLDIIQIPAFLCRQTDLVISAAKTGKPINIKKGQFLAPWDMKAIIEKVTLTGNRNIIITERGTTFGYNNLVSDMRSIPIMKEFGFPIVFDASHSTQLPGSKGNSSGGMREMIPILANAAVAAGCDGLFIEVHEKPEIAKSDGPSMLKLVELPSLLKCVKAIRKAIKS